MAEATQDKTSQAVAMTRETGASAASAVQQKGHQAVEAVKGQTQVCYFSTKETMQCRFSCSRN